MSSYYDAEAPAYDESRGGTARARAAADGVLELVQAEGICLDLAGGTGSVSAELAERGLSVLVADLSFGMLTVAAGRLPGRVLLASADRLPVPDESVDLVTMIWLLHLLPVEVADQVIAEASRVIRPGGHLVTTVDKDLAHGRRRRTDADHRDRVELVAGRQGLSLVGATSFTGPSKWSSSTDGDPVFSLVCFRKPPV